MIGQVIISLKPAYGDLVLSGAKTVELRNRIVRIVPGTTMWIYVTSPVAKIVALADLSSVIHDSPLAIWRRYWERMCIDRVRFDDYVGARARVSALVLTGVSELDEPVSIDRIRREVQSFHPPQFYSRVAPESGLFRALNDASGAAGAALRHPEYRGNV